MGHDIFAFVNDVEKAYLRRSAGNNVNRVIYEVLDSTDYYAGCSGNGNSKDFSKEEILEALKRLDNVDPTKATRSSNMADQIICALRKQGAKIIDMDSASLDLKPEKDFLEKCLENLESDKVTILFG